MSTRRITPLRALGIVGWTAIATGWVAGAVARTALPAPDPAAEAEAPHAGAAEVAVAPRAGPDLPDGGLIVIRHTPQPRREAAVVRTVVVREEAPRAVPTRVVSSGS